MIYIVRNIHDGYFDFCYISKNCFICFDIIEDNFLKLDYNQYLKNWNAPKINFENYCFNINYGEK